MEADRQSILNWYFERLADRLAEVFEAMSGVRPEIKPAGAPAAAPEGGLRWRQTFDGAAGAAWIQASERDWKAASNQILSAAGIENPDQETLLSTWTETLGQALAAVARDCSGRLAREVTCAAGEESAASGPARWTGLAIRFPSAAGAAEAAGAIEIAASLDDSLIEALKVLPAAKAVAASASGHEPSNAPSSARDSISTSSKTFDLLLDVELPVSVSFGRAQVPLKDVLKLTTGAIVELNRSISEPVEVIVNNCVIARGEVVVVEGNFGVKIREVISRQDRLRTLN